MKEGGGGAEGLWLHSSYLWKTESVRGSFSPTYLILFLADGRQHRVDIKEVISFHTGDNVNTLHVCRLPASISRSGKKNKQKKTSQAGTSVALS